MRFRDFEMILMILERKKKPSWEFFNCCNVGFFLFVCTQRNENVDLIGRRLGYLSEEYSGD